MADRLTVDDVDWDVVPPRPWEVAAWPPDGIDPFEPADETSWIAATNSKLGRAFPAGDWRGWGNWSSPGFTDALPMGYTALYGLERLALCAQGNLVGEWEPTTEPSVRAGNAAPPDPAVRLALFVTPATWGWKLRTQEWPTLAEALDEALAFSRHGLHRALVVRLIRSTGWH